MAKQQVIPVSVVEHFLKHYQNELNGLPETETTLKYHIISRIDMMEFLLGYKREEAAAAATATAKAAE